MGKVDFSFVQHPEEDEETEEEDTDPTVVQPYEKLCTDCFTYHKGECL